MATGERNVYEFTRRVGAVGAYDASSVTGTLTMNSSYGTIQVLTPTAARTVLLPPEAQCRGVTYTFRNASPAYALTIKEDSNTTTVQVLPGGFACELHCDGTSWYVVRVTSASDFLGFQALNVVDMAGAAHAIITAGTAGAGQTLVTSSAVAVDANLTGGGLLGQTLTLPAAATNLYRVMIVANIGDEIVTLTDAGSTALGANEVGIFVASAAGWIGGKLS